MDDATRGQPGVPLPLPAYNSVQQLRADAWNSLKDATGRLPDAAVRGAGTETLTRQASDLLELLDPLEHYWAHPGRRRFGELRELLARDDWDQLHKLVARITRALGGDVQPRGLPEFEVLVVDSMAPDEEEALR